LIRVYTVKENELYVNDVSSEKELDDVMGGVERSWVDCCELNDEETRIVSKLLEVEAATFDAIKSGMIHPSYAECRDEECPYYTWISTPVVEFKDDLKLHPLSLILKERFLITLRNRHSTRLIESALQIYKVLRPEERKASVVLAKIFSEIVDENSRAIVPVRDLIDDLEEEGLEKPTKKSITKSIFKLKRGLNRLQRLLWAEKELLSDMILGVVPRFKLAPEAKTIVDSAADDIDRELEIVDSYNNSLDSILRLQDLGSIHKVETNLVYLTIALVVLTIILIGLEMASRLVGG
jgi:Mg2+ and Co2+ transporter CorA